MMEHSTFALGCPYSEMNRTFEWASIVGLVDSRHEKAPGILSAMEQQELIEKNQETSSG